MKDIRLSEEFAYDDSEDTQMIYDPMSDERVDIETFDAMTERIEDMLSYAIANQTEDIEAIEDCLAERDAIRAEYESALDDCE